MSTISFKEAQAKQLTNYYPEKLEKLFDRPLTPLEILTRKDGGWRRIPAGDRLCMVVHSEVLPDGVLRLFAAACAERAMLQERAAGREPDQRSWAAVSAARAFAAGEITEEELKQKSEAAKTAWNAEDAAAEWSLSSSAAFSAWSAAWHSESMVPATQSAWAAISSSATMARAGHAVAVLAALLRSE